MAVTTSSGNGFALYNGVKLPNIDAYGGAFLWKVDLSSLVPDAVAYQLTGSKGDFVYTNSQSLADENGIPSATETWTEFINLVGVYPDLVSALWSSIESSELYSEPIPLDGMTVIEWDGDTEGLESLDNMWFKVSDNVADKEAAKNGIVVMSDNIISDTGYHMELSDDVLGLEAGSVILVYADGADLEGITAEHKGTYFLNAAMYTQLFAYTSSGGGSGDGGGDESTAEKHYCRVDGTVYEVEGGTAKMGGTFCEVKSGTVLIDGTVYDFALN